MSTGVRNMIGRGAGHFSAGGYRPDKPSDKVLPAGPPPDFVPVEARLDEHGHAGERRRRAATAANVARIDAALSPRRFSWEGDQ